MNASEDASARISDSLAFLIAARSFRVGAFAILTNESVRGEHETDRRFVLPAVMLLGHVIEVYLKAWLSSRGIDNKNLRKQFGHDLQKLFAEAKKLGLPEPERPQHQSFKDLVDSFAKKHGDYTFRYPHEGWTYEVPSMDIVFDVLNDLDVSVASAFLGEEPEALTVKAKQVFRLPPG